MAHIDNPEYFIRLLKGAPISVLSALTLARMREPVTAEWLQRVTGYSDKPVSQALVLLEEYGLAQRGEGHLWAATSGAAQMLMASPVEAIPTQVTEPARAAVGPDVSTALPQTEPECGNIPTPPSPSRSSSIQNLESSSGNQDLDSSLENLDSRAASGAEIFQANLAECDQLGITEPTRSRLAKLERVTPGFIRFHLHRTNHNLRLAIYRLEHPGKWDNGYRPQDWETDPIKPAAGQAAARVEENVPAAANVETWEPLSQEDADAWVEAVNRLPAKCWSWVSEESLLRAADGVYTARVGNHFAMDWLEENAIAAQLAAEIAQITGKPAEVKFVVR